MNGRTMTSRVLFECPACNADVYGQIVVEVEIRSIDEGKVDLTGKMLGVSVSHDCLPVTTR